MIARYLGSIAAGAFVTAALIFWMQLLIENGEPADPNHKRVVIAAPRAIEIPPPPRQPPRDVPPLPPPPQTRPPETVAPPIDPTTARDDFVGPATPPGPSGPPDHPGGRAGSTGPWALDSDFQLVADVLPSYPYSALRRELEGYVVVEFTVTRSGEVTDARVVESSDPTFDRAALDSISRARYRPRIVDGAPVDVIGLRREIVFQLDDQ